MKQIFIVGKMYNKDKTNGPTAVMYSLEEGFKKKGLSCVNIALSEKCGRLKYIRKILGIMHYKDSIINVHINGFFSAVIVCLISKINKRCDYYLTVHGVYREQIKYYDAGPLRHLYCLLERYSYCGFPNLICVSELCKQKVLEYYKTKGNIYVIENAVNHIESEITEKKEISKHFIFLGGTQTIKGIERILRIFNFLIDRDKEVILDIYGRTNENELALLNSKIEELGKSSYIKYCGMVTKKNDLADVYMKADYHIALSRFDTFNTTIIEAINYGCINFTNRKSGAARFVEDGITGFIINEEDTDETIANKIYKVINTISLRKYNDLIANAKSTISTNTWDDVTNQYLDVFEGKCK